LRRRRFSTLEYQELGEKVGSRGTMPLVCCGLIQAVIWLLIVAVWLPAALWLVAPALIAFLVLQLLRYALPTGGKDEGGRMKGTHDAAAARVSPHPPKEGDDHEPTPALPGRAARR